MNQCGFRHSARNWPLNDSMKPLSVGAFRPGEVEDDARLTGSQIEIAGDELRALINADRRRIIDGSADPFKGQDHVLAPVAEPRIHGRREK